MLSVIEQLNEKIEAMVTRYDTMKQENETLRTELVSVKGQSEAKDTAITKLEEENAMKDIEIEEIVKKIELALGQIMSKKITLTINSSRFDIDLEDSFARYIEKDLEDKFNVHGNNDIKTLLQAYVKKSYELFEAEEMLNNTLKKI